MSLRSQRGALLAGALVAAFAVGGTAAADAAPQTVDGVSLTWGLTQEAGQGAYIGGCNFLMAGKAADAGSSKVWAEADGLYQATVGNVSISKPGPSGPVVPTWATKCQGATGAPVNPAGRTDNQVVLSNGAGSVDLAAGTARVEWDGAFSVVFYGGMTYWAAENPVLTIADGVGTLTAAVSGFASSQSGDVWDPIAPAEVALATLSGIQLTDSGFTVTPDYLGVEQNAVPGQSRTGAAWGSFPESLIAQLAGTGQAPFWYSSGGSADPRKVATPLAVAWDVEEATDPTGPGEVVDEGGVDVVVTVPEATTPGTGELKLSVTGTANLGEAALTATGFTASGQLPEVTVTDTRHSGSWTANGQVSAFTFGASSIPASALGWTPQLISGTAQVGPSQVAGGTGLSRSSELGSGSQGQTTFTAGLSLVAAASTSPGDYTAELVLTVVG